MEKIPKEKNENIFDEDDPGKDIESRQEIANEIQEIFMSHFSGVEREKWIDSYTDRFIDIFEGDKTFSKRYLENPEAVLKEIRNKLYN